ncbi:MAG TPA: hypothetical protein P5509_06710, partial [Bacteroidales bacterium]|nr:hypothetical protein [Bacteroidales bacterium]
MKQLYTSLFLLLFMLLSLSQKAQVITVYEATGNDSYSNIPITDINVFAGQIVHLKVKIDESSANEIKIDTASFDLSIPETFDFIQKTSTIYESYPSPSATNDITILHTNITSSGTEINNKDYLRNELGVKDEITTDYIVIKYLKIQIPTNITANSYQLKLEHSMSGSPTETVLLTFHYQKPVITEITNYSSTKPCINQPVICTINYTPDLDYKYMVNGVLRNHNDLDTVHCKYGDIIKVKDPNNNPANGTSNDVTINTSYFKPLELNLKYPDKYYCEGTEIEFTLENYTCFDDGYSMQIWFGTESNNLSMIKGGEPVSQNFTFIPPDNGSLQVKIYEGETLIISSDVLPINKILKLDNIYTLSQNIRLSANQEPHNMFNELIISEGDKFNYENKKNFDIPEHNKNWEYFYQHQPGNDTLVGRFKFGYAGTNIDAYHLFDPTKAVAGGTGNPVDFYYGKYFQKANMFCMQNTSTNVQVDRNKIFIKKESFCSYDSDEYDVIIDITKLPELELEDDQESVINYKGYTINYLHSTIGPLKSESQFKIKPSDWKNNSLSTVEIKAYAHAIIRNKATDCPNAWKMYPEGYVPAKSDYIINAEVVYGLKLYQCLVQGTTERPGLGSDWLFIERCFTNIEKPPLEPFETKLEETRYLEPIGNCFGIDEWQPTLESPNYNIGAEVTYNGEVYKCIQTAYPNHLPNQYPNIWEKQAPCGAVGETVSEFDMEYASAVFYVHEPETEGKLLNLNTKFCPSKDSILLESNYK